MNLPKIPIIIAIVIVAAVGAFYFSGFELEKSEVPEETVVSPETQTEQEGTDSLEIASTIYSYIQTQRNSEGFYHYSSNCDDDCPFKDQVFKNANTWPTYASVGMFVATGEQRYLDDAERDADALLAWCEEDPVECVRVTYQISSLADVSSNEKYSNFVIDEADVLIDPANSEIVGTDMPMLLSIDSIQLADVYGITGDEKYLTSSIEKLNEAEAALESDSFEGGAALPVYARDGNLFKTFACWPQLAKIELYKSTGEKSYLDEVASFVDGVKVDENVHSLWFMTDVQPCIDIYIQMGELTGDSSYTDGAVRMMQSTLDLYWDTPSNVITSGNNAIKSARDADDSSITDSSYMVYLLSKVNSKFEVV